jgi:hypothetical protein
MEPNSSSNSWSSSSSNSGPDEASSMEAGLLVADRLYEASVKPFGP